MFTYLYAAFLFMEMEQNNKPELADKISIELKWVSGIKFEIYSFWLIGSLTPLLSSRILQENTET